MVAVQMLLMNYFLVGLHIDNHYNNDVLPPPLPGEKPACSLGCSDCSAFNGCFSCKYPFLLKLRREGIRQYGVCTTKCPVGFFGKYTKKIGYCTRCGKYCKDCQTKKNYCTECPEEKVLYKGRCKRKCPPGHPYNPHFKVCISDADIFLNGSSPSNLKKYHYSLRETKLSIEDRIRMKEKRRRCKKRRKKKKKKKGKKERRKGKKKLRHKKGRRRRRRRKCRHYSRKQQIRNETLLLFI